MPDWSGRTLGKVQVEELIARGGMAEVYLGEHTTLGRKVAVKIMRGHVDQDPDTVARFQREAHVVASLRHPNIVQMYDYEVADGQPCLVMEYVPGPTLSTYLKALHKRGEKLPLATVTHLLKLLAGALDYAHSRHIVHRDIKPANVLLRSASGMIDINKPLPADVEPILTDFGLVRLLDSSIQTSTGTVSGTPTYMSPEQARGDKVGPYTDIYALGVVLYEMLAGTVPFEADSTFGVLMKHLNDPPPPIFGISSDLQAVIDRALAKEPELRYPTATEFADEFNSIFNGETVSLGTARLAKMARKGVPSTQTGRSASFQWGFFAIGALVILGIGFAAFQFTDIFGPAKAPDIPVGQVRLVDFTYVLDKATVITSKLPPPESGKHYEVWFLAEGGEVRRNAGTLQINESGEGQLVFIDPEARNILELYDHVEVTLEPDNDPSPEESSGEIAASYVYPPLALIHLRHVLVSYDGAPEGTALIQGLWYTTDQIDTSTLELQKAFENNDEALVRKKTEEIINQLVGSADTAQYRDWDGGGTIDDPGDGFGLLGEGYISSANSHTSFASQASDATENIQQQAALLMICLENMQGWSQQLLEKALQLNDMPFGPEMEPLIEDMTELSTSALSGTDTNNNERIEPIIGEGGADTAYEYAYYMVDILLLPGIDRIPPPAPTSGK
ncbi:MAG: protein kinase [Chloroflexi bacterium]|nr:protein kinase [Chloroflexota bacterium]